MELHEHPSINPLIVGIHVEATRLRINVVRMMILRIYSYSPDGKRALPSSMDIVGVVLGQVVRHVVMLWAKDRT